LTDIFTFAGKAGGAEILSAAGKIKANRNFLLNRSKNDVETD
jgi:hypothetical protein